MRSLFTAALVVLLAACNQHEQEKAGQTVTTAADHAVDAGAQELKREWRNLDVKVGTGNANVDTPDGGVRLHH